MYATTVRCVYHTKRFQLANRDGTVEQTQDAIVVHPRMKRFAGKFCSGFFLTVTLCFSHAKLTLFQHISRLHFRFQG